MNINTNSVYLNKFDKIVNKGKFYSKGQSFKDTFSRNTLETSDRNSISDIERKVAQENKEKTDIIKSMVVEDIALKKGDKERLIKYLSNYSKEILNYVGESGFKIHVLANPPQPEGKIKPSDLGYGDHNGDGVVNKEQWVDFNRDGTPQPWEYEGMVGLPDGKGGKVPVSLDNYMDGAYMPGKNVMYVFAGDLSEKQPNNGKYTMTHEFAHALDFNLRKDPKIGKKFHNLVSSHYNACKDKVQGHKFYDGYQASSRDEYFAVCAQSFMTPEKIYDESGKFDIVRCRKDNLKNNDPHMYKFVDSFLKEPLNPNKWYDFTK